MQALPHGAVKKSKSSQESVPNQETAKQALLACQTVVTWKRNLRLLMFVGSITMLQKKGAKRAATEMAQEAPHTQPITCNYSNPGRQRKAADTAQRMVASALHQHLEQMPGD